MIFHSTIDYFLNSLKLSDPNKHRYYTEVIRNRSTYLNSTDIFNITMVNVIFAKHGEILSHSIENNIFFVAVYKGCIYHLAMSNNMEAGLKEARFVLEHYVKI